MSDALRNHLIDDDFELSEKAKKERSKKIKSLVTSIRKSTTSTDFTNSNYAKVDHYISGGYTRKIYHIPQKKE